MKSIFRLKHAQKTRYREILKVGFPVMVMNSIGSLTIFLLNTFINRIDDGGEGILGVYIKLQSFVLCLSRFIAGSHADYGLQLQQQRRFQRALNSLPFLLCRHGRFSDFQFLPHILLIIIPLAGPYNDLAKIRKIISISFYRPPSTSRFPSCSGHRPGL